MQTPCLLPSNTAKVNYHSPEQLLFQLPSLASFHLPFLNLSLSLPMPLMSPVEVILNRAASRLAQLPHLYWKLRAAKWQLAPMQLSGKIQKKKGGTT
jgi:hypothetical protein